MNSNLSTNHICYSTAHETVESLKQPALNERSRIHEMVGIVLSLDEMSEAILDQAEQLKKAYDDNRLKAAEFRAELLKHGVKIDPKSKKEKK